jgi:hypothetical protein
VRIRRGPPAALGGGLFRQRLRLINVGGALEAPISVVVTGLRRKARLRHPTGVTALLFPGSPFVDVLATGAVLPPGGRLTLTLVFSDRSGAPAHYAVHVLAGAGAR